MTIEEAIILIECSATELVGAMAEAKNESEAKQIQRYIDAYDMAISALRQQETVESCEECGFCEVKAEKETLNEQGCRH